MSINPAIIKAYDVRGLYPSEINAKTAFLLGRAYVAFLQKKLRKKRVALSVGRDLRFSSDELARFFTQGATDAGADVIDLGEVTTPLNYFAVSHLGLDGGAMITASHSGPEYNGVKFIVRKGKGMFQIGKKQGLLHLPALANPMRRRASNGARKKIRNAATGVITKRDVRKDYVDFLLRLAALPRSDVFTKLKIAVDASGGSAITVLPELLSRLGITYKPLFFERDSHFKKHSPNPLKPESQRFVREELKKGGYAFGVVFDGDADRVQFFDERGRAVPNGSILGILAGAVLGQKKRLNAKQGLASPVPLKKGLGLNQSAEPIGRPNDSNRSRGSVVVLEPVISLGVEEYIREWGGIPQRAFTGTAFIKEGMKKYNAVLGGESSGHFYFKEFFRSDSACMAFLSVLKIVMREKKVFSALVRPMERYVSKTADCEIARARVNGVVRAIGAYYRKKGAVVKKFDGLGISFPDWRAHIRSSNTEPILRVFAEAKTDELLEVKFKELLAIIRSKNEK